ncbi:MAG: hypothetical protein KME22_31400 [Hassallia sp. WJT32-NPBG1]|nr:hypothetical protein [Hassallia sp. WJT32-NPBG1]
MIVSCWVLVVGCWLLVNHCAIPASRRKLQVVLAAIFSLGASLSLWEKGRRYANDAGASPEGLLVGMGEPVRYRVEESCIWHHWA